MIKTMEPFRGLKPEVDYQALMAQMPHQSNPRRKLKDMQNKGYLIRVKKGFYVFTEEFFGKSYSHHIVANLLYGPSYISLESALSFYGLIPERVEMFTSITSQKNKNFNTPIGVFNYQHLSSHLYSSAFTLQKTFDGRSFLIASPEKALLDLLTLKFKKTVKPNKKDIADVLEDDLRISLPELKKHIHPNQLENLKPLYQNRHWPKQLIHFLLEEL